MRNLNLEYAELLRFERMHEKGGYYMPQDFPTLETVHARMLEIEQFYQHEELVARGQVQPIAEEI